jgi:hypothetical protein
LGPGAPRRRVPLPVSFSHRRVGSSILASLSEAGGNDLRKTVSKPLPPRLPPFTYRHVKRAYSPSYCMRLATVMSQRFASKLRIILALAWNKERRRCPELILRAVTEPFLGNASPGTLVMTGGAPFDLWVFLRPSPIMTHEPAASLSPLSLSANALRYSAARHLHCHGFCGLAHTLAQHSRRRLLLPVP